MEQIAVCRACTTANRINELNSRNQAVCGRCGYPLRDDLEIVDLREDNFERLINGSKKPVLVDFWAQWCNPCRIFLPTLKKFQQLHPEMIVTKLDVDDVPSLAGKFSIQTVPTLILFQQGELRRRVSGVLNINQIESFVQS